MKHLFASLVITLLLLFAVSIPEVSALGLAPAPPKTPPSTKPIGAPLDGGVLTLLGAAGIAYYLVRKRNQNI